MAKFTVKISRRLHCGLSHYGGHFWLLRFSVLMQLATQLPVLVSPTDGVNLGERSDTSTVSYSEHYQLEASSVTL